MIWFRSRILLCVILLPAVACGQNNGGNGGGNQGGGNGGGNGNGGVGGISINASGLVEQIKTSERGLRDVQRQLQKQAAGNLPTELNQVSELRRISLRQLDLQIEQILLAGDPLPPEIISLAGLTQIDLIAITDDRSDVIIAGPAEGFAAQSDGRVVGTKSGRPVLCLDDLLVAFRTASDRKTFGCSFDPDSERLANCQQLLQQHRTAQNVLQAQQGFRLAGAALGNWDVTVFGVPEDCHMAIALVEADFALKVLATGQLNPGVRGFKSYLTMMKPNEDSMRRWWFSPLYEAIETNEQRTAFRLSGPRVQVSAQDEIVDAHGNRTDAPFNHVSVEQYAQQLTEKIPAVASKVQSIAQLQNMVDLFVTAAIIQQSSQSGKLDWLPVVLNDSKKLMTQKFEVPREVPSVVNVRMAGSRTVLGLIAGGVTVTPGRILAAVTVAESLEIPRLEGANMSWWWD